ncbi:uncharacterized protein LOC115087590 [Rhinatrema bivittatum]|uniref:uncharacterized protein LOC115087590 n=1 Tax=Rhinatrema bivittatum TaxID=194408 RepID=UPI00112D5E9B|nr:uncharacterized protein LOC115087590 [Rhinatrema bivittatum]
MEEAILQLSQELRQLQVLCTRQAVLLQKLTARKEPSTEMPVSMPVQCTDAGGPELSENPFFRPQDQKVQNGGLPTVAASELQDPMFPSNQRQDAEILPSFDIKFPPTMENYSFLNSEAEKEEFATVGYYGLNCAGQKNGPKLDRDLSFGNFVKPLPSAGASDGESLGLCKARDWLFLNLADGKSLTNLSDLYEVPSCLKLGTASVHDHLPAEGKSPVTVRGPTKTWWCVAEDYPLDRACDFCQAIFPEEAATQGDYLKHLTDHIE